MLDFTKNESDNIKILSEHIQNNGSSELSRLFRIDFLKIDEIQEEYISIINNTYSDIKEEIKELKELIQNLDYRGAICI